MSVISLLIFLVVVGVVIWAINTYIPMDAGIKKLISVVGVIICILYVLYAFGVIGSLSKLTVPHL